jgi:hypothetical protein
VNPVATGYVAFDAALGVLALRSLAVLGRRAPLTSLGWAATAGYCVAAIVEFTVFSLHRPAAVIASVFFVCLAVAFVVAGVRDERQAEPWWWPVRAGATRAERRASGTPR